MDELTPDQAAELAAQERPDSEAPDEITPDQAEALHATGSIDQAPADELNPDAAEHMHALSQMNGTFGQGPVPVDEHPDITSGNTAAAAKNFYANHDSRFRKLMYTLNLPQQFLMRQVTAALAPMGLLPDEEAKQLLSQNELAPHDLLDYYWKPPLPDESGKHFHTAVGLLADVILDPLNMIGLPLSAAGKSVTIAGKTITGLEKMSEAQRAVFQTMGSIEKIITDDGKLLHAGDMGKAGKTIDANMNLLAKARDSAQAGNPLGFMGLQQGLELSAQGEKAAQNIIVDGLTQKSAAEQLAAGLRELTIGLRVPFTNIALETKIPGPMAKAIGSAFDKVGSPGITGAAVGGLAAGPIGALAGAGLGTAINEFGPQGMKAMDAMAQTYSNLRNVDPVQGGKVKALADMFALDSAYAVAKGIPAEAYRMWQNLWTKTSDVLFNQGMTDSLNLKGATSQYLAGQTNKWNTGLAAVKERLGPEPFKNIMEDFLNEAERGIYTPEEAFAMAKKRGVDIYDKKIARASEMGWPDLEESMSPHGAGDFTPLEINPNVQKLYTPTVQDLARAKRVSAHPELVDMLGTMREQLKAMVGKYEARKIPFDEINPFGEGWMNRYVKHTFTNEWKQYLAEKATAQDAWSASMRESEPLMGTFDESALGRKYRGSILDANQVSMEKQGIKMFVDNPVQLFNMRIQEMQDAVAKHDLIKSALPGSFAGFNPGFGWMKANQADFGHMESLGKSAIDIRSEHEVNLLGKEFGVPYEPAPMNDPKWIPDERKVYQTLSFLPEEFRNQMVNGQNVYFRSEVYDRMLWNTQKQGSNKFTTTMAAADAYTWFWRNQVLANTGYIGTKWFHNALSYFGLMQNSNPKWLMKATTAVILPDTEYVAKLPGLNAGVADATEGVRSWDFQHTQPDGTVNTYNREQFMDLAGKHGLLNTGASVLFDDVLDHMAASYPRSGGFSKLKTATNYAYMFGMYRAAAQYGDDIPKLAVFAQRLEQGFTAEAAAEAATRYFYNFSPVTAEQQAAKALVPFVSFPMKTAELVASQIRNGDLIELAMPGHVQSVLQGKYVEDRDVRDYLTKTLPTMKNWYEPLHGGVTPGMRSMAIELPWCYNTVSLLWNEEARMHPIFQLISGALAAKHQGTELDEVTDEPTVKKILGQNAEMLFPQGVKTALTLAALNGVNVPFGDFLIEKYQTKAPDPGNYMAMQVGNKLLGPNLLGKFSEDNPTMSPSDIQVQQSALNEKFQNATDFGRWMDKSYGNSWLYNLMFHGSLKADEPGIFGDSKAAARGEYVRQHIRDMSLGLVQMDKLDQTMFTKYLAVDRELKKTRQQMLDDANKSYNLVDPKSMLSKDSLMRQAQEQGLPAAKKALALMDERNAIIDWYDWNLGAKKKVPDFSLYKLLLGIDQIQMSSDGKPGPEVTAHLYPKNSRIPDDRAMGYWGEQVMKKWFPSK